MLRRITRTGEQIEQGFHHQRIAHAALTGPENRSSISNTASRLFKNTSRHMVGLWPRCGEITKATGRIFDNFESVTSSRSAAVATVLGNEMRQVAGDSEDAMFRPSFHSEPQACQKFRRVTAEAVPSGSGVRMHQRFTTDQQSRKRPDCSVPAMDDPNK
jgi:hypothetical protein